MTPADPQFHANTVRELSEEAALALIEHGAEDADDRHAAICDAVDALQTQAEQDAANLVLANAAADAAEAERDRLQAANTFLRQDTIATLESKLTVTEAERDHARDALRQIAADDGYRMWHIARAALEDKP